MKLFYVSALVLFAACNNADKKANSGMSMPGAYKMLSNSVKTDSTDTTYTSSRQMKIYTDGYMMYANINSPDSVSGFGICSYSAAGDTLTGVGFGKFEMKGAGKINESLIASTYYQVRGKNFDIDIEMKGTDEFKQTMNNADGSKSIEVYQRLKK